MRGRTLVLALAGAVAVTFATSAAVLLLALRPAPLDPVTPPLLDGVTAGSGWTGGGCPLPADSQLAPGREALSPDLTARLAAAFPAGSAADALQDALLAQGFRLDEPCRDDPAIRRAVFVQTGGGLAGPFPIHAVVAWTRTEAGTIAWTKGLVAYRAP